MKPVELEKGTLVIVVDNKSTPPLFCWGLIINIMPSDNCEVRTGKGRHDKVFKDQKNLIPIARTNGKFKYPEKAVRSKIPEILLYVAYMVAVHTNYDALKQKIGWLTEKLI